MEPIPHTQHHPICAHANPVGVPHPIPFKRCFNLWEADWDGYSTELNKLIEDDDPIPEKYSGIVDMVHVAYRRYIPRGCRTNYIPGVTAQSIPPHSDYTPMAEAKSTCFTNKVKESKDNPKALFRLTRNLMGNSGDKILPVHTCNRKLANDFQCLFHQQNIEHKK